MLFFSPPADLSLDPILLIPDTKHLFVVTTSAISCLSGNATSASGQRTSHGNTVHPFQSSQNLAASISSVSVRCAPTCTMSQPRLLVMRTVCDCTQGYSPVLISATVAIDHSSGRFFTLSPRRHTVYRAQILKKKL